MSIVLNNLSKRYGNSLVVNRISLEVQNGEMFVLLGASGSGKSTILRLIAGLATPESGTVELDRRNVTDLPPQQRGVGFVFQNYSLFRHMNVADNVEFGLKVRKIPAAQRRAKREELLELVGLGGLGNRYSNQLSGGQQQRVALARALAYEPSVLLLDEPFGALDVKIRGQLRRNLRDIQQKLKLTTILVTHDQEEAFELADRIGVMERGNLIEIGTPQDLYHRPKTEFAANFVGGKNLLIGRVEEGGIRLGATALPVPVELSALQTRVRILFRPETVLLQKDPFDKSAGVHLLGRGKVVETVFAGSFQRVRLEVERPQGIRPLTGEFGVKETIPIEAVRPSNANGQASYQPGDLLWTGFKEYHVLETYWPKLLLCQHEEAEKSPVAEFGCSIAAKARGQAVLFSVTDSAETLNALKERLEAVRQKFSAQLPQLEVRVRRGDREEEILREAQEGHYEMVILGQRERSRRAGAIRLILQQAGIPVLVVQEPVQKFSRFLICSAVGEPGKVDVRVGGRLARLVGAHATVLHAGIDLNQDELERRERHLQQALSTLETFGVPGDIKIGNGPAIEFILEEAESNQYDLIVMGAPHTIQRAPWQDAAGRIINNTRIPVLIVPMTE